MPEITTKPNDPSKCQELFHYTSISALKGILENNTLWATRIDHLNDSSEMERIWPHIQQRVIQYFKEGIQAYLGNNPHKEGEFEREGGARKMAQSAAESFVDNLRSGSFGQGRLFRHFQPPFVISFTTHHSEGSDRDEYHSQNGMLSQWRGYGGDDGVALVFHKDDINQLLNHEKKSYVYLSCQLDNVVYDKSSLDIEEEFADLFRGLRREINAFTTPDLELAEKIQTEKVVPNLLQAVGRLKHDAFYEEMEDRIVVGVVNESIRNEPIWQENGTPKSFKSVHYRKGGCGSIPYIRLFEDTGDLPIKRIIVGPSRNQMANRETIMKLIGNREISIETSKTPFGSIHPRVNTMKSCGPESTQSGGFEPGTAFGIDGCKGGWFYIALEPSGTIKEGVLETLGELITLVYDSDRIFVDIPIGLSDGPEERLCDREARRKLGFPRRCSVFPAPVRAALKAGDYEEAKQISQKVRNKSLSIQSWAIMPKIKEVDELLQTCCKARDIVREVHPEICF